MKRVLLATACAVLSSCAGYQLGGSKPPSLSGVNKIAVTTFENGTLHPRAEAIATSAVSGAFVQDGTYRLANRDGADAVLEGKVARIEYNALRSSNLDSLVAEELTNNVSISWRLVDAKDPTRVLATGVSHGSSRLFVDSNLQTARQNALPDAFERAAVKLVSKLSSGY